MKNTMTFEIATDLFIAGRTEDGREFFAECYFVMGTDTKTGDRIRHEVTFNGTKREVDEEGCPHFPDMREEAMAKAERLLTRVQAAPVINMAFWREERPVYGSRAYQAYGMHNDWAEEQHERMGA